jgi:hypothetical protein
MVSIGPVTATMSSVLVTAVVGNSPSAGVFAVFVGPTAVVTAALVNVDVAAGERKEKGKMEVGRTMEDGR